MLKLIIGKIKESFFVLVPVWNSLRLMIFSVIIISLGLSYQINIDTPHASWSFIKTKTKIQLVMIYMYLCSWEYTWVNSSIVILHSFRFYITYTNRRGKDISHGGKTIGWLISKHAKTQEVLKIILIIS